MRVHAVLLLIPALTALAAACLRSEAEKKREEAIQRFHAVLATQAEFLKTKRCPGCDLFQAQLGTSDLWGANLEGAYLKGADMTAADLREANLRKAVLIRVDFSTRAQLQRADLTDANLTGANLGRANLAGAILCRTTMPDGSLRNDNC